MGYYAKRFGKRFLMRIAAVAGLLFGVGMLTVHTPALLLALQLLNAIYIGILAGIRHALLPGSDAGSGRRCHHPLYHPRGLDYCRLWRALWLKSGTIIRCSGLRW